ncbi:MAG: HlyD family efflux transporter periplasmic adaptor subunit [Lysobacter sp.]|nr:HlyD family efflux transporter periplasmic adaptor subunit [Lysobacter sp.]
MSVPDPLTPAGGSNETNRGMGRGLFRQEVLMSKANPWLGKTSLAVPVSFRVYSIAASVLLALTGALLYFGSYTVTETTQALILPRSGVSSLASPVSGTIIEVHAAEGQTVKRGTVVLSMRSEAGDENGAKGADTRDGTIEQITAPMDGTLYSMTRTPGERVSLGEALFVIAPDEPLVAITAVSPTVKAQVRTGARVQLQLTGLKKLAKGKVVGRLEKISVGPLGSVSDERGLASGLNYRAVIEIDPSASTPALARQQLLGQTAEVRIPIARRRLYEWMLDPMRILFGA